MEGALQENATTTGQVEQDAQIAEQQQAQLVQEVSTAAANANQKNQLAEILRLLQLQNGQLTEIQPRIQRLETEASQREEANRRMHETRGHPPHGNYNHQLARPTLHKPEELAITSHLVNI